MFFLVFLSFVLLGSFGLLAFRADLLKGQPELDSMVSRESAFLLNNIVLVSALFTIFLGTIFPLLSEAIAGTQVSVGAPYFNSVTVPLFLFLVFLMGVGPMIAWRRASWDNLKRNFLWPAAAALVSASHCLSGRCETSCRCWALPCSLSWCLTISLRHRTGFAGAPPHRRRRHDSRIHNAGPAQPTPLRRLGRASRRGVDIMGIAGSMTYSVEREATLALKRPSTSAITHSIRRPQRLAATDAFPRRRAVSGFHRWRRRGVSTPRSNFFRPSNRRSGAPCTRARSATIYI